MLTVFPEYGLSYFHTASKNGSAGFRSQGLYGTRIAAQDSAQPKARGMSALNQEAARCGKHWNKPDG